MPTRARTSASRPTRGLTCPRTANGSPELGRRRGTAAKMLHDRRGRTPGRGRSRRLVAAARGVAAVAQAEAARDACVTGPARRNARIVRQPVLLPEGVRPVAAAGRRRGVGAPPQIGMVRLHGLAEISGTAG